MGRAFVLALGLVGCYQPEPADGARCSLDGLCPAGQTCVGGACRDDGFVEPDDAVVDAALDDAAPDAPIPVDASLVWAAPTKIPGVNSTSADGDPSLTPDRLTIVFASSRKGNGNDDIFIGTRAAITDAFVVAELAIVNTTTADEQSPELSADGRTLYFTSDRNTAGSSDVYVSRKIGGVFAPPTLVAELSSSADEGDLAISPDGLTAMLARGGDLYLATRATTANPFTAPVLVSELTVTGNVAAPSITDGAATVYLHAGTTRDLYVAYRQGTGFTTPVPITELNTAGRDAAPFISPDDRHLAFEHSGELFESTR